MDDDDIDWDELEDIYGFADVVEDPAWELLKELKGPPADDDGDDDGDDDPDAMPF